MGEGGQSGGQELRDSARFFPLCTTGLGCGRTRFGSGRRSAPVETRLAASPPAGGANPAAETGQAPSLHEFC